MKTKSLMMGLLAWGAALGFMPASAQAQEYCREYTRTVYIGNRAQVAYGTACYQPNGDWKIVDETDQSRIGQRFRNEDVTNSYYQPVYQPVYQPISRTYYYRTVPQQTRFIFVGNDRSFGKHYRHRDHDRRDGHRGRNRDGDRDRDRDHRHR